MCVCLHRVCSRLHAYSQACTNNAAQEQQKETRRCGEHFQSCDSVIHRMPFWSTNTLVHRNRAREMTARWKRRFGSYFQHSEISTAFVSSITMVTEDYLLLHNWGCALKPMDKESHCAVFVCWLVYSICSTDCTELNH